MIMIVTKKFLNKCYDNIVSVCVCVRVRERERERN